MRKVEINSFYVLVAPTTSYPSTHLAVIHIHSHFAIVFYHGRETSREHIALLRSPYPLSPAPSCFLPPNHNVTQQFRLVLKNLRGNEELINFYERTVFFYIYIHWLFSDFQLFAWGGEKNKSLLKLTKLLNLDIKLTWIFFSPPFSFLLMRKKYFCFRYYHISFLFVKQKEKSFFSLVFVFFFGKKKGGDDFFAVKLTLEFYSSIKK